MHDLDHCIRDQFILNSHAVQMIESIYLYSRLHEFGKYIGFANSGNVETQSLTNQKT